MIVYNDEKRRNQGQIQEPCTILDEAFYKFLQLPIVEFLDLSLKTSGFW